MADEIKLGALQAVVDMQKEQIGQFRAELAEQRRENTEQHSASRELLVKISATQDQIRRELEDGREKFGEHANRISTLETARATDAARFEGGRAVAQAMGRGAQYIAGAVWTLGAAAAGAFGIHLMGGGK